MEFGIWDSGFPVRISILNSQFSILNKGFQSDKNRWTGFE
ncbi:Uncharacterized protein dnm_034050 [Desulfonema magnum]|uniref:Uncharacterized protein n=1 Tax=Desulfonema magnum TaxID=45655 RepID=A0A975GN44_9BACT|nr:Uncharacterized protein dnm_034050 [Desulfonema magnum]